MKMNNLDLFTATLMLNELNKIFNENENLIPEL